MEFHMGGVRYPVMRNPVYGRRGMVSASQPLAAQAGISILKRGGNAVDAAIAAAACLVVTEPTSNGIGGDCFVQVWRNGRLYALNASRVRHRRFCPRMLCGSRALTKCRSAGGCR